MDKYNSTNIGFVPKPSLPDLSSEIVPIHHGLQQYGKPYSMQQHRGGLQTQPIMKPWVPSNIQQQEEKPLSIISSKHIDSSPNDGSKHTKTKQTNNKCKISTILKIFLVLIIILLASAAIGISIYGLIDDKMMTTTTTTTTSTTSTTTTTTTTAANLPTQCSLYISISDASRLATASGSSGTDSNMFSSTYTWYRFIGASGSKIVTSAPNYNQCGTYYSGWYAGTMPTYGNTLSGTVCYVFTNICYYSNMILVTNCGSYYVYGLISPPYSPSRYCTA